LKETLDDITDKWGIDVEAVTLKDIRLPDELQRSMAAEAEAKQSAKAKVKTTYIEGFIKNCMLIIDYQS